MSEQHPRSWIWDTDGDEVAGAYQGFSQGHTKTGDVVPIVVLKVDTEARSIWLFHTALRERFLDELRSRPTGDLGPGELVTVRRGAEKQSASNPDRRFRAFDVSFEHKRAPSPLDLLSAGVPLGATQPPPPSFGPADNDIPF